MRVRSRWLERDRHKQSGRFCRLGYHYGKLLREHQEDVGRTEGIGFGRMFQAVGKMFEIVDGFITEIADQAAGKARQAWDFGRFEAVVEGFDKGQGIAVVLFDDFAV